MTARTRFRRLPARGTHDRGVIEEILDEALVCHLGFVADGDPVVIPTLHARVGDDLYVHGSAASRTQRALSGGLPVCLTATLIDGLVLARSAFHHSVNYRSVMAFGAAEPVAPSEKPRALEAFVDKLVPGRWPHVRLPTRQELKATGVLRLRLDEASAKVRCGPPGDDQPDYELGVWAGVVPIQARRLQPEPDPRLAAGIAVPEHVRRLSDAPPSAA